MDHSVETHIKVQLDQFDSIIEEVLEEMGLSMEEPGVLLTDSVKSELLSCINAECFQAETETLNNAINAYLQAHCLEKRWKQFLKQNLENTIRSKAIQETEYRAWLELPVEINIPNTLTYDAQTSYRLLIQSLFSVLINHAILLSETELTSKTAQDNCWHWYIVDFISVFFETEDTDIVDELTSYAYEKGYRDGLFPYIENEIYQPLLSLFANYKNTL